MAMKTSKSWGLVVPGRAPTPSEGHAQIYTRVGPQSTQRLIAFDNGTCLSFGPDDLVDEFGPLDPFAEQVALVDKAIRDCQTITQRHATINSDDENEAYRNFRANPLDHSKLVRVKLPIGTFCQIPSKYASVGTTISVYAQNNKSDVAGEAHPGLSVDTRFGVIGRTAGDTLQEKIRRDTDREREQGVRERDEEQRNLVQRNRSVAQQEQYQEEIQPGFHGNRLTRRGRRTPRETTPAEQQRESSSNGELSRSHGTNRPFPVKRSAASYNQGSSQAFKNQNLKSRVQEQCHGQTRSQEQYIKQQAPGQKEKFSGNRHGEGFQLQSSSSSSVSPFGKTIYTGIPMEWHSNHVTKQIMSSSGGAELEGQFFNPIPQGSLRSSAQRNDAEVSNKYQSQGLDLYHVNGAEYLAKYSWLLSEHDGSCQIDARGGFQEEPQDRVVAYAKSHRRTAQQADRELARFADELNRQQADPEIGHLRGDTFVGEPAFRVQPPSPEQNVLASLTKQRNLLQRAPSQQSIGTQQSTFSNHPGSDLRFGRETESSESGAISEDDVQRGRSKGIDRARDADERRTGSGGQRVPLSRSTVQMEPAVLASSGIFSREPSPLRRRNGRLFDLSRQSSPGSARLNARSRVFERSASVGNLH